MCYLFFFFKQKTAYDMRISDWSSDVCSSDLCAGSRAGRGSLRHSGLGVARGARFPRGIVAVHAFLDRAAPAGLERFERLHSLFAVEQIGHRSEEQTSDLQSLMRISYAVFCWQNNKNKIKYTKHVHENKT